MNNIDLHANSNSRRLVLTSLPERMAVRNLELDVTCDCNLCCVYCYKRNHFRESMSKRTAFDAIVWLIHASGSEKNIGVFCMGGEPLLQFGLFKTLIPFAIRRAKEHGKKLSFSVTTNCTLVDDSVIDFFKEWDVGLHTSIDGVPFVQDANRPSSDGKPSSQKVEKAIPSILAYRPSTCARATILPVNLDHMFESYLYFRSLGYTNIAMVPGEPQLWCKTSLSKFEKEVNKIADHWKEELKQGTHVWNFLFAIPFQGRHRKERPRFACGAARGLISIDSFGNIWPCVRWDSHFSAEWHTWKLGNIYEGFSEQARDFFIEGTEPEKRCEKCIAKIVCAGGCYACNFDATGKIDRSHDNSCKLLKIQSKIAIKLYDELYEEKHPLFMQHYCPEEWKKMIPNIETQASITDETKHECELPTT